MKSIALNYSVFTVLLLMIWGCEKDSEQPEPTPSAQCRIKSINQNSLLVTIAYRADGKVLSTSSSDGSLAQYSYDGDTVRIEQTNAGFFDARYTIVNNANGLAEKVKFESNETGTAGYSYTYQYNGTEVAQSTQKEIGTGTTEVTTYTWQNGNLKEIDTPASETIFEYYVNEKAQAGGFLELSFLIQGFNYIKNKNLLKSVSTNASSGNVKYDFDADGKITAIKITGTAPSDITCTYQCK